MDSMLRVGLKSTVAKNAASLYVILVAQYILPLITVPYLVRVLEPSGYGLVAFGQSFIAYFTILADFGFAFSATRKISLQREDISAVSRTASHVWTSKAFLAAAGFILLLLAITLVPKLQESSELLFVLYGAVIGSVLFPTWLFQGMERMVAISAINLIMQLFIMVGVFMLIHRPEDYMTYAVLLSTGSILSGLIGASIAFYMFKLQLVLPSKRGIIETLREGWMLFLSMASVSLYTAGNAFMLGLLTNATTVGYYSAAEKIMRAVLGLLGPISQAVYPRFSKMASDSTDKMVQWSSVMIPIMGCIGLALTAMLFFGAPMISSTLFGPEFEPSVKVMRILSFVVLNVSLATIWSTWIMIGSRRDKAVLCIIFGAGIINLGLAFMLIPLYQELGIAISWMIAETFVNLASFTYTWTNGINPVQRWLQREGHYNANW